MSHASKIDFYKNYGDFYGYFSIFHFEANKLTEDSKKQMEKCAEYCTAPLYSDEDLLPKLSSYQKGLNMGRGINRYFQRHSDPATAVMNLSNVEFNNLICLYTQFILLQSTDSPKFKEGFEQFKKELLQNTTLIKGANGECHPPSQLFAIVIQAVSFYSEEIQTLAANSALLFQNYKALTESANRCKGMAFYDSTTHRYAEAFDIEAFLYWKDYEIRKKIFEYTHNDLGLTLPPIAECVGQEYAARVAFMLRHKAHLENAPLHPYYFQVFSSGGHYTANTTKEYARAHLEMITGMRLPKRNPTLGIVFAGDDAQFGKSLGQIFAEYVKKWNDRAPSLEEPVAVRSPAEETKTAEVEEEKPATAVARPIETNAHQALLLNNLFCLYCIFVHRFGEKGSSAEIEGALLHQLTGVSSASALENPIDGITWPRLFAGFKTVLTGAGAFLAERIPACNGRVADPDKLVFTQPQSRNLQEALRTQFLLSGVPDASPTTFLASSSIPKGPTPSEATL